MHDHPLIKSLFQEQIIVTLQSQIKTRDQALTTHRSKTDKYLSECVSPSLNTLLAMQLLVVNQMHTLTQTELEGEQRVKMAVSEAL